jgi:acyl carrier protein
VRHIVADLFSIPVEQITQESSPDTIEAWDSLQHLNLVLALEQEFSVQLMPEEIEQLLSIQDIVTLLAEKPHTTERLL